MNKEYIFVGSSLLSGRAGGFCPKEQVTLRA